MIVLVTSVTLGYYKTAHQRITSRIDIEIEMCISESNIN